MAKINGILYISCHIYNTDTSNIYKFKFNTKVE